MKVYTIEFEVFVNLRILTPLFPKTQDQKTVNEDINTELGKHMEDFSLLFQKTGIKSSKLSLSTQKSGESTEDFLENLEHKQKNLITNELTEKAISQLNLNACTDYELLKHQKQGLIWMLERENFYEHNANNKAIEFSDLTTQNLKGFLNPLWTEYTLSADIRCPDKLREIIERKIKKANPKNDKRDNKMVVYFHKMTGQMVLEFPHVGCHINFFGGLVADEMGMGKTILVLSLIGVSKLFSASHQVSLVSKVHLSENEMNSRIMKKYSKKDLQKIEKEQSVFRIKSKSKGKLRRTGSSHVNKLKTPKPKKIKRRNKKRGAKKTSGNYFAGNLIIVPTILMAQWEDEINSFYKKVSKQNSLTTGLCKTCSLQRRSQKTSQN
jgi:SNF2 family DNA or RNA helicase